MTRHGGKIARKHHYVPRWYLRGFLRYAEKPQLAVIDLARGSRFSCPPEGVAAERDFHTIDVEGHPPDALEKAFADFDNDAAAAVRRIVEASSIADRDAFTYVLNLMSLIAAKNPRMRDELVRFQSDLFRRLGEAITSRREVWESTLRAAHAKGELTHIRPESYDDVRDFIQRGEYEICVPQTRTLTLELEAQDGVLQALGARNWTLLRAPPKSPGFVTSDHPVCLIWTKRPAFANQPIGFGLAGTHVVFPLTKGLALAGSFEAAAREIDATADQVAHINGIVVGCAHRQVYAPTFDFEYDLGRLSNKVKRGRELLQDRTLREARAPVAAGEP